MAESILAPCPFCGAKAHFEKDSGGWEWIECESCGMQGNRSASLMEDCKPKLREAWNRRAAPAGWKLAPVEPTQAMIDSDATTMDDALHGCDATDRRVREDYAAMLSAAPDFKEGAQ